MSELKTNEAGAVAPEIKAEVMSRFQEMELAAFNVLGE